MSSVSTVAFKEWAAVVKALASGEQILILRKGGIHERGKKFDVRHDTFLLFPTYEHQNAQDLNPRGQKLLEEILSKESGRDPSKLEIGYFASVEESFWIRDFQKLLTLSPFHVWSEQALRNRFEWGEKKGLYALVVRVWRLPEKQTVRNLPAYGGCRSWVELDAPISLATLKPVLSEGAFETALRQIRDAVLPPLKA